MDTSSVDSTPGPIFVVGYMHSGTTLLLNILRNNTAVFSEVKEPKFFRHMPLIRRRYSDLDDPEIFRRFVLLAVRTIKYGYLKEIEGTNNSKDYGLSDAQLEAILKQVEGSRDHGTIYRLVFDSLAKLSDKTRWVQKTIQIDECLQSIPDARLIEIVRDPRDVLAAKKTRRLAVWQTDRYESEKKFRHHLVKAFDPLWDTLSWISMIRATAVAREKYPFKIMSVRYEDLVADSDFWAQEICEFVGIEFEPEMLEVPWRNPANRETSGPSKRRGIGPDSIGRWRNVLTPAEVSLCQLLAAKEMRQLGYCQTSVNPKHYAKIPLLIAKSSFEFFIRLSRRYRMGGVSYLINILIIYWKRFLGLTHGWLQK